MIVTRDREAGNIIEEVKSFEEGKEKIKEYEEADKKDGTFEPDFYEVAEVQQVQNGWICRTWTETSLDGWTSEFESFETEQEAIDHGRKHNKGIKDDELSREFEIYKRFTPEKTLIAETHLDTAELEK